MLTEHQVDAVVTGGVDRNMGTACFVKFCKIGRTERHRQPPFWRRRRRLRHGRGLGAPPAQTPRRRRAGRQQNLRQSAAWAPPPTARARVSLHRTPSARSSVARGRGPTLASTPPRDASGGPRHHHEGGRRRRAGKSHQDLRPGHRHSGGLGSAKGNIGHLKAGAGAAGLLKAMMAVHQKVLPPTLNSTSRTPTSTSPTCRFRSTTTCGSGTPPTLGFPARRRQRLRLRRHQLPLVVEEHVPGMLSSRQTLYSGGASRQGNK